MKHLAEGVTNQGEVAVPFVTSQMAQPQNCLLEKWRKPKTERMDVSPRISGKFTDKLETKIVLGQQLSSKLYMIQLLRALNYF